MKVKSFENFLYHFSLYFFTNFRSCTHNQSTNATLVFYTLHSFLKNCLDKYFSQLNTSSYRVHTTNLLPIFLTTQTETVAEFEGPLTPC